MGRDEMRAGDADRQKVADQLKAALDEGRLDLGEYDERIQKAYGARTYGDLDPLLIDLPGTIPVQKSQIQPAQAAHPVAPGTAEHGRNGVKPAISLFLLCTIIWGITSLASGEAYYFWPVWVLIPVAFAILARLGRGDKRREERDNGRS
ncbi:DUF1707 domain-containing protein [Actinoplanes sp. OR16]|uniref:DUF1707 SHOCT-like domain-containing protein n=1 Tax=Actinoplanes sp. OR16 TaxID=946334 RepID=UPI001E2BDA20|nr:DUF1707 domain-containing protein [Actinoplanes sp. OR16]